VSRLEVPVIVVLHTVLPNPSPHQRMIIESLATLADRVVAQSEVARARLLAAQDRLPEALDAYLEAYRAGVASQMEAGETDVVRWREGVREVEEICGVLVNYGPRVEGSRWMLQARSIVRTFMGRTKDFEDDPEWSRLVELLDDLKR